MLFGRRLLFRFRFDRAFERLLQGCLRYVRDTARHGSSIAVHALASIITPARSRAPRTLYGNASTINVEESDKSKPSPVFPEKELNLYPVLPVNETTKGPSVTAVIVSAAES